MSDTLSEAERKMHIIHTVVHEMAEELQDGWYDRALAILNGKKRKIIPKEEFNSDLPVYETGNPNYER